jgi:hypothetical protein
MPDSSSFDTGGPRPALTGYSRRALVLGGLWVLFIALTLWGAVRTGSPLLESLTATPSPYDFSPAAGLAGAFAVNLWALAAGLFFGLVVVPIRLNWGMSPPIKLLAECAIAPGGPGGVASLPPAFFHPRPAVFLEPRH